MKGSAARLTASLGVLAALPLLLSSPVSAAPPADTGYWWHGQSGVGPLLPAPPNVPDGGLWIAADPSGAEAVSALRMAVPDGTASVVLRLTTSSATGTPAVQACPTDSAWAAAAAGAWADRPTADCGRAHAAGVATADGWSFDVGSLVRQGVLNIAIVPVDGAVPFSLSVAKPTTSAFVLTSAAAPESAPAAAPAPQPAPRAASLAAPVAPFRAPPLGFGAQTYLARPAAPRVAAVAAPEPTRAARVVPSPVDSGHRWFVLVGLIAIISAYVSRSFSAAASSAAHPLAQSVLRGNEPVAGVQALLT